MSSLFDIRKYKYVYMDSIRTKEEARVVAKQYKAVARMYRKHAWIHMSIQTFDAYKEVIHISGCMYIRKSMSEKLHRATGRRKRKSGIVDPLE